ncbi:MAG: polyamine aminopropyltransferase [Planctomycetota bacterium]
MRVVRTRRGAKIVQDDVILSEILERPGPTHGLFDVLAGCVAALAPGPRFAMLGFAGGGMVAPLRAMGFAHEIDAVDLSREGETLFRELSRDWAGTVRVAKGDAVAWLRGQRERFDVIVEDLSTPSPAGVVKPYVSFALLPDLIRSRLRPGGIAITNLLPLPGTAWSALLARTALPHARSSVVGLEEYENRFVLAGDALPTARAISKRLRAALRSIGSDQAERIAVRTLYTIA